MRSILKHRALRLVFTANLISMLGSGMNAAAVTWFILQATRSETALGTLVMLQTLPAMLMLPFTGVIIDREDRRRLVMLLDAARAIVILAVATLALRGQAQVWHLYAMAVLVAAGFWMFWPTVTALIQELTPDAQFVTSNTFLLAGVQGGWLLAGAVVGFVYNHIGLGGVLLLDVSTYVVSFVCYLFVRRGRHVVKHEHAISERLHAAETAVGKYLHELHEGWIYVRSNRYLMLMGTALSLFIAGMMAQGVLTAPFSDSILHAGAVGYGWLNGGWGTGAFISALYSPLLIRRWSPRLATIVSMSVMALGLYVMPFFAWLWIGVAIYAMMGSARGISGVAIQSSIMEIVPKHFMGRVQNTFYFLGTVLQIVIAPLVGAVSHHIALSGGFAIVGSMYLVAAVAALAAVDAPRQAEVAVPTTVAD